MLYIQYVSDLHIDGWCQGTSFYQFVTPVSPFLVIAGDICSAWSPLYKYFLDWASRNWHTVIIVAGNHEYHCTDERHTIFETDQHIHKLCKPNVHFLQNGESYILPGTKIRFVGATLWSRVDPSIYPLVENKKKDYTQCWRTLTDNLTPHDTTQFHEWQTYNLNLALDPVIENETLIVVTHYMPSLELLEPEYKNEAIHTCYASNDDWLLRPTIRAWICGHGHRALMWRSPYGAPVYMNARGYNKLSELNRTNDKYNPSATLSCFV